MGFLNNIGNAITGAVNGVIGTNISVGSSSSGSSTGSTGSAGANHSAARKKVIEAYQNARIQYHMSQGLSRANAIIEMIKDFNNYRDTPPYHQAIAQIEAEMDAGANANAPTISGIINQAVGAIVAGSAAPTLSDVTGAFGAALGQIGQGAVNGVANGVQQSVGGALSTGIGNVAEDLVGTPSGQSFQATVGNFFTGAAVIGLTGWLKRNWFYILIPISFLLFLFFRNRAKNSRPRANTVRKATRTRTRRR